jgi:hypothetical protein
MASTTFANLTRPGVFITETTAGYRVPELASFNTVYMIGSSATGDYHLPTLVTNLTDFTNQFGASPSTDSVRLFFRNDRQGKLYFIRTKIADVSEVTITEVAAEDITITINGTNVITTLSGTETDEEARDAFITAINSSAISSTVTAFPGAADDKFRIRVDDPDVTLSITEDETNITVADVTPESQPEFYDYVYAITNTFDLVGGRNLEQGFLIAPEAFANLANASERQSVGTAMENLCADKDYDWLAIVDCAPDQVTAAELQAEGQLYTTAQGHLAFYAPYLIDLEDNEIPPSAAIAGLATRRYREQGYQEPPAGANYPVRGVKNVTVKLGNTVQSVLNPLGINLVRYLMNIGVVAWAARTRSSNSFYTFVHTRVIMNALNGTLRDAFDYDLFTAIDGFGILFSRIQETARGVCRRFWLSRALYGATEEEAFEVICSRQNNLADDLENGNVLVEVYVAPVPMVEKLLINTIRVPIGQVQDASAAAQSFTV